ncbi:MAG: RNA polymerase sigma factor [Deltaproteobacteria bacterium]|nr:RNA polymerase sigma factor [Deltaproteobacteria bacterium]
MTRPHLEVVAASASLTTTSDDYLMLAAAEDSRAFATLVTRHEAQVRAFCALLLGDAGLAREAAQDVFLRLWRARRSYRPQGKLKQLVLTIARNRCRSIRRRRFWRSLVTNEESATDLLPAPAEVDAADLEVRRLVTVALAKLDDKFRVPLFLRFFEGLDYDAIAAVIGRTPSAARSRVHYGLRALAALLPEEVRHDLP